MVVQIGNTVSHFVSASYLYFLNCLIIIIIIIIMIIIIIIIVSYTLRLTVEC